jgi:general secretion pathway protein J
MRCTSRGFTLVEVMVALFIMAVLAGMAWRGIDGIARTRESAQARMEQTLRMSTVLAQWERDLTSLYDDASTEVVPALAFDGANVRLLRRAEGGVQLVTWSLRGSDWWRWASPVLTLTADVQDQWMRSQQLVGSEPGQVRSVTRVAAWQIYCFRDNAWTNCQSSADLAPAAPAPAASGAAPLQRTVLPTAVRLVLALPEGTLTRDVLLGPQIR